MKGNKNITSIIFFILSTTSIPIIVQNTFRQEFNDGKLGLKFEYDESIEYRLEKCSIMVALKIVIFIY